jgi:hypothetical protein
VYFKSKEADEGREKRVKTKNYLVVDSQKMGKITRCKTEYITNER